MVDSKNDGSKKILQKGAGRAMSIADIFTKDGYLKGWSSRKLRRNQGSKIEIIVTETPSYKHK
ncbi:hypothetical protein [Arcticibacterium luteifluviistationis]|uniref:Uncharacterized protein n=1 Tax=Arcticibacterium luteifluviistationis TaxID=1784714 RepID=A0A2Z4G7J2_9BACT|nr:hypothetical protein [Arcticibacterium luteifluviistationis]AWV97141.1 hypothetical protein DJ013_02710 [Arcticibacterium luteifluviistationis]